MPKTSPAKTSVAHSCPFRARVLKIRGSRKGNYIYIYIYHRIFRVYKRAEGFRFSNRALCLGVATLESETPAEEPPRGPPGGKANPLAAWLPP